MSLISYFNSNKSALIYKYLNHGTLLCPLQVFFIILYIKFYNNSNLYNNSNFFIKDKNLYPFYLNFSHLTNKKLLY